MNAQGRTVAGLALGAALWMAACGGSATEASDAVTEPASALNAIPKPGDGEEGVRSATAYFSFEGVRAVSLQKLFVELQEGGRFVDIEMHAGPQREAPRALNDIDESVRFVIIPTASPQGLFYEHTGGALPSRDPEVGYFVRLSVKHYELVDGAPVERLVHYGVFTPDVAAATGLGGDLYRLN